MEEVLDGVHAVDGSQNSRGGLRERRDARMSLNAARFDIERGIRIPDRHIVLELHGLEINPIVVDRPIRPTGHESVHRIER
jgi:hypothetical protein